MWLPSLEELHATHNRLVTLSDRDFRGFPGLCWVDVSSNQITTVMPELVANTRCTVHGIPDVLRIYLQGKICLLHTPSKKAQRSHSQIASRNLARCYRYPL